METHISWVILTGRYAYKIKKPVNFGFVDFSTLDRRRHFCEEELRLNRRLAGSIYLGVVPIAGPEEQARIDGRGAPIEYALKMRQFGQRRLFGWLLANGSLKPDHIDQFAERLAEFHASAGRAEPNDPWGTPAAIQTATAENFRQLLSSATDRRQRAQLQDLQGWTEQQSRLLGDLFEKRRNSGFVRECHGDLHLGNLVLIAGRPTAFDCIEFNENLRWIDVVSEIAFLGMDLESLGRAELAYRFLNRYQALFGDYAGLRLWNYYRLYRAMVRAKVSHLTMRHTIDPGRKSLLGQTCQRYLDFGLGLIEPRQPVLIITHGLSGAGKSYLAAALSERLPAIWLRSDIERKRIAGANRPADAYSAEMTRQTYDHLRDLASLLIKAGSSVIVDAAFLAHWQRKQQIELARTAGVRLSIIDIQTPLEVLKQRIRRREQLGADPSEATLEVLRRQLRSREPLSEWEQQHALPVGGEAPGIERLAAEILSGRTAVG